MNTACFLSMVQAVYEEDAELYSSLVGKVTTKAELRKIRAAMRAFEAADSKEGNR